VTTALPLDRRSVLWRVNGEPFVFLGGGRALLLQVAHPKVAAGVEQHSSYVTDPWGRLFRTVDVMAKLMFGSPSVSAAQAALLDRIHRRVTGTTDDGEHYDALDPELLVWVWATLCDTALLVYERVRPRLSTVDRDRYYAEWKLVAAACGVPEGVCPATWTDFRGYFDRVVLHDLQVTPAARSVAHATMVPPLPRPLGAVAAGPNQLVAVGLLPPSVRSAFGFEWDRRRARQLRAFFAVNQAIARVAPRRLRESGMWHLVQRNEELKLPRLRRVGTRLTARRMAQFDRRAS
jgi:uncharacterized protein (DUF2236 family)